MAHDNDTGSGNSADPLPRSQPRCLRTACLRVCAAIAVAASALLVTASPAFAAPRAARAAVNPWPALPFTAWVRSDYAFVRDKTSHGSKLLALLRTGDTVTVSGCAPSCDAPRPWALLAPRGAVPLSELRAGEAPEAAARLGSKAVYFYGRVPRGSTPVYAAPEAKAKVLRRDKAEFRVAFVPNAYLGEQGWLQRPDGGYMKKTDVKLFTPSVFAGQVDPELPLAFVRRKVALRPEGQRKPPKDPALVVWHNRYDRLKISGIRGDKVSVAGGWLPKGLVRTVTPVQRPKGVETTGKWLHVELGQQVLAAYEGDKMVFATLISAGKSGRMSTRTHTGRFEVYGKTVHSTMRGKPWDDYYAEEVPHVMHFDGGRAFHGAYWHDQFGIEKSHGCINLSPADAAWLFRWIPPDTPDGWHNTLPVHWGGPTVAVFVDKPNKRETTPVRLTSAPQPNVPQAVYRVARR